MSIRSLTAVAVVVALAASAWAELDAEEKSWLGQCIERLQAKSERVRHGAEDALVAAGPDAIDLIVAKSSREGDVWWTALEKLAPRMGRETSARRLGEIAAAQKDAARKRRCSDLAARLQPPAPGAAVNPELAAKVAEILRPLDGAKSFSSDDPAIGALVALGHDVVPILVEWSRDRADTGMSEHACRDALKLLVVPGDVPLLAAGLAAGAETLAAPLGELAKAGCREALDVLHEEVRRGGMTWDLAHAIESSPDVTATSRVLADWLRSQKSPAEHNLAAVATAAEKLGVCDLAPLLAARLPAAQDEQTIRCLGLALTALGDRQGPPTLLRILSGEVRRIGRGTWGQRAAAERLAEISGLPVRVPELTSDHGPPTEVEAQYQALTTEFRKWWARVKDRIRFDPVTRRWSVPE